MARLEHEPRPRGSLGMEVLSPHTQYSPAILRFETPSRIGLAMNRLTAIGADPQRDQRYVFVGHLGQLIAWDQSGELMAGRVGSEVLLRDSQWSSIGAWDLNDEIPPSELRKDAAHMRVYYEGGNDFLEGPAVAVTGERTVEIVRPDHGIWVPQRNLPRWSEVAL